MDFQEYQKQAMTTAQYPSIGDNPYYPALGLAGEAGEVANAVKKIMRDSDFIITPSRTRKVLYELGDCLWYIAALCHEFNLDMNQVAEENLKKLKMRKEDGTIVGDGDER